MHVRHRHLPTGWYPDTERQTRAKIEFFRKNLGAPSGKTGAVAGILPHAGWDYSGALAFDVVRRIGLEHGTVVVVGGHLSPSAAIYAAFEDAFETPLGSLVTDKQLLQEIARRIDLVEDRLVDNTVEVQLPLVKFVFPEASVLSFRVPPAQSAIRLAAAIRDAAGKLDKTVVVLGSTDLTHYGPAYGFEPRGTGEKAVKWVKDVNDRRFLEAILSMRMKDAMDIAVEEQSACSAGAAVAAAAFAAGGGVKEGRLINYLTSWDVHPSSSFVGYAGIVF